MHSVYRTAWGDVLDKHKDLDMDEATSHFLDKCGQYISHIPVELQPLTGSRIYTFVQGLGPLVAASMAGD